MATAVELKPGEARTLNFRPDLRYLIHRPGRHPLYLVFEENARDQSVEALGTFTSWTTAVGAIRARQPELAKAV